MYTDYLAVMLQYYLVYFSHRSRPINRCNQISHDVSDVQGNLCSLQTFIDAYSVFTQIQLHNFVSFTSF